MEKYERLATKNPIRHNSTLLLLLFSRQEYLINQTSSRPKTVINVSNNEDADDPLATHIFQLQVSQDDTATGQ